MSMGMDLGLHLPQPETFRVVRVETDRTTREICRGIPQASAEAMLRIHPTCHPTPAGTIYCLISSTHGEIRRFEWNGRRLEEMRRTYIGII